MESTRIMHVLNIDGNGKELLLVDGLEPEDESIKRSAIKEIIDYEFIAAGKPSVWSGKLKDLYYESGFLVVNGEKIPFSYCSVKPSEQAHQDLLSDIGIHGYSLVAEEHSEGKKSKYFSYNKIIGICITTVVIAGIILSIICK
jgi:hypothetical protein